MEPRRTGLGTPWIYNLITRPGSAQDFQCLERREVGIPLAMCPFQRGILAPKNCTMTLSGLVCISNQRDGTLLVTEYPLWAYW